MTTPSTAAAPALDEFVTDWSIAKEYWKNKHRIFDFSYLQYRSILTTAAAGSTLGDQYLRAFGQQVFVPLTFQTVEAINSQATTKKTEIVCTSAHLENRRKARFFTAMDNGEWQRSKAEIAKNEARYNALIFGNGYLGNFFVFDKVTDQFLKDPRDKAKKPNDPSDGTPDVPSAGDVPPAKREWEKRTITRYKGMKPTSLNPYYVFPDPQATSQDDWQYCYVYAMMPLKKARAFAVAQGWCSEDETELKVPKCTPEKFDKIRDTVDSLYQTSVSSFNRTDNTAQLQAPRTSGMSEMMRGDWAVLLCRYEGNSFEVRAVGNDGETLHKDHNIYPHKEIPIIVLQDVKIPHEFLAMGEPEILRWQQVEYNKIHNYTLGAVLMATVPRYALIGAYLQDESDASYANPFKPIRLKPLPGMTVSNAIQAMPMSDVKQTPFQLMELVRATAQATTGASDFVVSSNTSETETATESNNLVAATYARISEKIKRMDEEGVSKMIDQWHQCYMTLYDEEMDLQITGENVYYRYLPYDRSEANENREMIAEACERLDVYDDQKITLEQVYMKAGYQIVIFASDLMGRMVVETKFADLEINRKQLIAEYKDTMVLLNDINNAASAQGEGRRFNVFKLGEDLVKQLTLISNIDDYIVNPPAPEPSAVAPAPGTTPAEAMPPLPAEMTLPTA